MDQRPASAETLGQAAFRPARATDRPQRNCFSPQHMRAGTGRRDGLGNAAADRTL
jgi:hypothetical protein